jgi:hypothetical protein
MSLRLSSGGEREKNERREGLPPAIEDVILIEREANTHSTNYLPPSLRERLREILARSRDPRKSLDQARSRALQILERETDL